MQWGRLLRIDEFFLKQCIWISSKYIRMIASIIYSLFPSKYDHNDSSTNHDNNLGIFLL